MPLDRESQKALDQKHLATPKNGDYWHEMFCPVARVLDVSAHGFVILQKVGGMGGKEIDAKNPLPCVMSLAEFEKWLSYGTRPGTWASVIPEHFPVDVSGAPTREIPDAS